MENTKSFKLPVTVVVDKSQTYPSEITNISIEDANQKCILTNILSLDLANNLRDFINGKNTLSLSKSDINVKASEFYKDFEFANEQSKLASILDWGMGYSSAKNELLHICPADMRAFLLLKQKSIETLKKYGDAKLLIDEDGSYSGVELAAEIENGTDKASQLISQLIHLTIDLLSRDKLNSDWIKVTEILPPNIPNQNHSLDVLVCRNGKPMAYTHSYNHIKKKWFGYGQSYETENITHWMEMPQNNDK